MHIIIIKFIKISVLLLIIAQVFLCGQCNKENTGCITSGTTYNFTASCNFEPEREVYAIGDTIILESILPKMLPLVINPTMIIDYSNSTGVGGDIRVNLLDTISRQAIPAKDSFRFISIIGNFQERTGNQNGGINFLFTETPQSYHFKGAIVCSKKGIYGFGVSDLFSNGIRGKNCTKAGFTMTVTNPNKHLHLHQYALGVDPSDPMLQRIGYDFRVQ